MQANNLPLVVVIGATGKQGGAVAHALLEDGGFRVRAVTRQSMKDEAQELAKLGAEIFEADISIPDSLVGAFDKADYVFCLTNTYDKSMAGKETECGINFVKAAQNARVKHFVWSSLPNVRNLTEGRFEVAHFTEKGLVDEELVKSGLNYTVVMPAFFFQNFEEFFPMKLNGDQVEVSLPMNKDADLSAVNICDIGPACLTIFKNPQEFNHQTIPLCGAHKSVSEYLRDVENVTGRTVKYNEMSKEEFANSDAPSAGDLAEMFSYFEAYGYYCHLNPVGAGFDIHAGQKNLNNNVTPFDQWLQRSSLMEKICPQGHAAGAGQGIEMGTGQALQAERPLGQRQQQRMV